MKKYYTLSNRLNEALKRDAISEVVVWHFLKRLEILYDEAHKVFIRRMYMLLIAWGVILGISNGMIKEGRIDTFRLSNPAFLLGFAPLVISLIWHGICNSAFEMSSRELAIRRCYTRLSPELVNQDLEYLLCFPSFISSDQVFSLATSNSTKNKFFSAFDFIILSICFLIGPLSIFIFAILSAYYLSDWWWQVTTIIVVFSVCLWLRSFFVLYKMFDWLKQN